MFKRFILISVFLAGGFLSGQKNTSDFDLELESQNSAIKKLREEIKKTRNRINSEIKKEKSAARRITNLAEEISLVERLVIEIKKEESLLIHDISRSERQIAVGENELDSLRIRYGRRAVKIYKRGTLSNLEKILSSTSWRQAVYRGKYLKIISKIDRQTHAKIRTLLIEIGQQKLNLQAILRKKGRLKKEREQKITELKSSKRKKNRELARIRQSKQELSSYLLEKQAGVEQLASIIKQIQEDKARFERAERIRRQQALFNTKDFRELKGKLIWPASGRIISKFGRQWNPKLKTTTENPGIDIKGKPGTPVHTILGGIVTTITFIRGYGTTIIIDHGGGFYSVYSHVTKVSTNIDSEVQVNDIIAYMGDSGSISGSQLHFEIWGRGQKLDPEKWLIAQ